MFLHKGIRDNCFFMPNPYTKQRSSFEEFILKKSASPQDA